MTRGFGDERTVERGGVTCAGMPTLLLWSRREDM